MSNNWFSNILPAITAAASNIGNEYKQDSANLGNNLNYLGNQIMNSAPVQAIQSADKSLSATPLGNVAQPINQAQTGQAYNGDRSVMGAAMLPISMMMGGDDGNPDAQILDSQGNPMAKSVPAPETPGENGGKFVNEDTTPLKGDTPAQVKAKAGMRGNTAVKFKYIPPQIETETPTTATPQVNTASGELPPITNVSEGSATLNQPARPSQPALTNTQKVAQKLNGLSNYQLPPIYGENRPNLEAQDKSVMQNVIGGNTADQVLQNANKAKTKIWNQVESAAGQHQTISSNNQVMPYIKARLDNLVNEGTITQAHANLALQGEARNLTQGGADITGDATITGNQLVDLRTGANSLAPKQIPYGSTNPIPYVRKAIAEGYSDAMGNLNPNINNLYQQYSSVKRIGEMPDSFRNQSLTLGKIPGTNIGIGVDSGLLRRGAASALQSKATLPVIGGLALTGAAGLGYLGAKMNDKQSNANGQPNTNNNFNQHNTPISTIIPQPYSNIKPDSDGHFDLSQNAPTGSRTYMSENDYQNSLLALTQKYPAGGNVYNSNKALLDSQYANDQAQAGNVFKGNNIMNFMDNADNYNDDGNSLFDTFSGTTLGQGFWNGVKGVGSIGAYQSKQYATELQQISAFDKEFSSAYQSVTGETPDASQLLSAANSPQQAGAKWASMMQFINGTYSKYEAPYLALTSSSGTQNNQGLGSSAPGIQNNGTPPLPAITSSGQGVSTTSKLIPLTQGQLPTIQ